jgi:hypothetical protein
MTTAPRATRNRTPQYDSDTRERRKVLSTAYDRLHIRQLLTARKWAGKRR